MRITNNYILFFGKNDITSNFYKHTFIHQNKTFNCSEQAFMWRKAIYFKDYEIAHQILTKATHPNYAKSLGKKVKNFNDEQWSKVRFDIMKDVVSDKINQFPELKQFIKKHKNKIFVEASPYDSIWGVKLDENHKDIENPDKWKGLNLLGNVFNELK